MGGWAVEHRRCMCLVAPRALIRCFLTPTALRAPGQPSHPCWQGWRCGWGCGAGCATCTGQRGTRELATVEQRTAGASGRGEWACAIRALQLLTARHVAPSVAHFARPARPWQQPRRPQLGQACPARCCTSAAAAVAHLLGLGLALPSVHFHPKNEKSLRVAQSTCDRAASKEAPAP